MAKNQESWKKHMTAVRIKRGPGRSNNGSATQNAKTNFASYLPAVYAGLSNRIDRYKQYEQMDQDSEISTGLDIIAEFCTQNSDDFESAFTIHYRDSHMGDSEVTTLENRLDAWMDLNDFTTRIFDIFRNSLMYGDQFFIRDPETYEWLWVDQTHIEKVTVDLTRGKKPVLYFIKDLSLNLIDKVVSNQTNTSAITYPGAMPHSLGGAGNQYGSSSGSNYSNSSDNSPFPSSAQQGTLPVLAEHVIHLSQTTGMDAFFPFGTSILDNIFKTYKQKELLEDSIIIYRVQRAPERRVFKIDVGDMPEMQAMAHVERIKNEIHQRRIPTSKGGSSSMMDAAYNPMCLDMNTRVPLLDGRTLTITELQHEYQLGKENWVYSCHPTTGEIVPGNITWAGVTRKSATVIKLTLDNGESVIVTPDHKIPVLGYGFKEAKDLTIEDSLIAFNTKYQSLASSTSGRTYQQVYDHTKNDYVYTHRMVAEYFKEIGKHQEFTYLPENVGKNKNVVHHADYDRYNNDPRNLQWMNHTDHFTFHSQHRSEMWANMTPEELSRVSAKISNSVRTRFVNLPEDEKQVVRENMEMARQKSMEYYMNPENKAKTAAKLSLLGKQRFKDHPEKKLALVNSSKEQQSKPWPNVEINFTREMLNRIVKIVKDNGSDKVETIALCDIDSILLDMFNRENPVPEKGIDNIDRTKWGYNKLEQIVKYFGFNGWKEFRKNVTNYNHKIVSIEYMDEPMDVGTITVDGNERWHNFHTFAIESGIFVKNSILEDFFFPQTADGRGSSVETLPGGDNLGQIDDLRWFNNKLIRGLKIPQSYLPFGPEDSGSVINDGRMGTALIQEFRFNKYCQRLQNTISKVFDKEFKYYLEECGYQFNFRSFEVKFRPPVNFASYRKAELESTLINCYQGLNELPFVAKQTILKKMGWTQDEIIENESFWLQENPDLTAGASSPMQGSPDLKSVGIDNPSEMPPEDDTADLESQGTEPPLPDTF